VTLTKAKAISSLRLSGKNILKAKGLLDDALDALRPVLASGIESYSGLPDPLKDSEQAQATQSALTELEVLMDSLVSAEFGLGLILNSLDLMIAARPPLVIGDKLVKAVKAPRGVLELSVKVCTGCGLEKPLDQFAPHRKIDPTKRISRCRVCNSAISRAWQKANPDKVNASQAARRKANPEKTRASKKAWQDANREKVRASNAAWSRANRRTLSAPTK
jgi:hypothetical protein